jgi:hypothetical protein
MFAIPRLGQHFLILGIIKPPKRAAAAMITVMKRKGQAGVFQPSRVKT